MGGCMRWEGGSDGRMAGQQAMRRHRTAQSWSQHSPTHARFKWRPPPSPAPPLSRRAAAAHLEAGGGCQRVGVGLHVGGHPGAGLVGAQLPVVGGVDLGGWWGACANVVDGVLAARGVAQCRDSEREARACSLRLCACTAACTGLGTGARGGQLTTVNLGQSRLWQNQGAGAPAETGRMRQLRADPQSSQQRADGSSPSLGAAHPRRARPPPPPGRRKPPGALRQLSRRQRPPRRAPDTLLLSQTLSSCAKARWHALTEGWWRSEGSLRVQNRRK